MVPFSDDAGAVLPRDEGPRQRDDSASVPKGGESTSNNPPTSYDTDLLIVGAGPTGLVLALEAARYGLSCTILDRNDRPSPDTGSCLLSPRTLELLENVGVVDDVLDAALSVVGLYGWAREGSQLRVDPTEVNAPFPRPVVLEQHALERILTMALANRGKSVLRPKEFVSLTQDASGVTARIRRGDNAADTTVRARWLVGCDGAGSTVRDALGVAFVPEDDTDEVLLAVDAEIDWDLPPASIHVFVADGGFVTAFPLAPRKRWRLAMRFRNPPDFLDALPAGPAKPELVHQWFSPFIHSSFRILRSSAPSVQRVRRGSSESFRVGRVFLAGDAAQVHSPSWALGLNASIADACNLGWKLGLLRRKRAGSAIVSSYEAERRGGRAQSSREFDTLVTALLHTTPFSRWTRAAAQRLAQALPSVRRKAAEHMSRLKLAYETGPAIAGKSSADSLGPGPGMRVPDVPLRVPSGRDQRLFEVLRRENAAMPTLTLLVFAGNETARRALEHELLPLERALSDSLSVWYVVWDTSTLAGQPARTFLDPGQRAHRAFGALEPTLVLVRPDGHVGFRDSPPDVSRLNAYLAAVLALGGSAAVDSAQPATGQAPAFSPP